jgi:hypothetical protein
MFDFCFSCFVFGLFNIGVMVTGFHHLQPVMMWVFSLFLYLLSVEKRAVSTSALQGDLVGK